MIVFVESDQNDFTAYLNPPLYAQKVRLIRCSLYNSWYNLIGGVATVNTTNYAIPDSHYTPQTLAKELAKHKVTLTTGLPHEWSLLPDAGASVSINQPIKDLIGHKVVNSVNTYHWNVPSNYEIHCDLVHTYDKGTQIIKDNLTPSHVMAKFSPKGNPFDLVEYHPPPLYYSVTDLITQFHFVIKVDGKVVDFNSQISLVLEFV